jgi:hypothetical protein
MNFESNYNLIKHEFSAALNSSLKKIFQKTQIKAKFCENFFIILN